MTTSQKDATFKQQHKVAANKSIVFDIESWLISNQPQ